MTFCLSGRRLALALLVFTPIVFSHAGDAVSALNGKLGATYGDFDSDNGGSVTGSVAVPLSTHFGAQLDGLYSNVHSNDFYGTGGHLFWRDSEQGLIGVAVAGVDAPDVKTYEAGVEAEYYFRWVTPGIYAGYSKIKYDTSAPFIDTDRTAPFGTVYVGFYPLPDLLVRPSYTRKLNENYYGVELEYAVRSSNLALTAEAVRGQNGFEQTQFGVRYYFGGTKSLKARHREDDPANLVSGAMTSVRSYQAEYVEKREAYINQALQANAYVISNGSSSTIGSNSGSTLILSGGNLYQGGTGSTVNPHEVTITGGTLTLNGSNVVTGGTLTGTLVNGSTITITNTGLAGGTFTGATINGSSLTLNNGSLLNLSSLGSLQLNSGSFTSTTSGIYIFTP